MVPVGLVRRVKNEHYTTVLLLRIGRCEYTFNIPKVEQETLSIKCKCGKWLVKDGIMGHKAHEGKV